MKSIVLCERTLVQESENLITLKEERVDERNNEKAEEENFNGVPENEKSESVADNLEKDVLLLQNGDKPSDASSKEDVSESALQKRESSKDSEAGSENFLTNETNTVETVSRNSLCSDRNEMDCSVSENVTSENKVLENLEGENSSEYIEEINVKSNVDLPVKIYEVNDEDAMQVKKEQVEEKLEKSSQDTDSEEKELKHLESKGNIQPMDGLILDMDENKENEKDEKTDGLEDYSESDLNKLSNGCEIQVGEVQTISGAEKDSMWAENDLNKSKDKSEEYECHDISTTNDESMNTTGDEKEDEAQEERSDENTLFEGEENPDERMHIEVEESEQAEEMEVEEKENDLAELENFSTDKNVTDSEDREFNNSYVKPKSAICRKRQMPEKTEEDSIAKKKKLAENGEEADQIQFEEENTEDSSRCERVASLNSTGTSSKGQALSKAKAPITRRTSTDEKNDSESKPSMTTEQTEVKKSQTTEAMLSVLEKFRGTLKTLTRSDLEELIVQKLCEVITERSNVGELRRKAQALEQDQERWKIKAQSLTKQMREMEMVMKKYMTEVQKQIKEGENHVVTPLKVTRSVGLQVSFYSSANKGPKPSLPQPSPPSLPQNVNARTAKSSPAKLPVQYSPTQNVRNKPASYPKSSPSLQKSPVNQHRRPIVPKPDYTPPSTNRQVVQQPPVNNTRAPQNPVTQTIRQNFKAITAQLPQQQQQTQPQQQQLQTNQHQQQNGSKVIDLTDDDDRQTGNVVVKTSGPIRVVNHLSQPPATQNNRFAYFLPTSSATSTATSAGQSRQVLIATPTMPQPNRQIMCSMPPLLFKGGNVVQTGTQPQMLNQSNKVILPKFLRHPAPLPKRPINQNTRPSLKLIPPRPALKISKVQTGIVLSWNMALSPEHAPIASYQLYAYQESDSPPATSLWKKVGDVKALPLPMACTLTQFMSGHKYHFAVRAVDLHSRIGPFSFPGTIVLV